MAQSGRPAREPTSAAENGNSTPSLWRRIFGRANGTPGSSDASASASASASGSTTERSSQAGDDPKPGLIRRVSRKVVPGLPRAQTFKRQQSELRNNLEPVQPTPAERRALSVDRRQHSSQNTSQTHSNPRCSAPDFGTHSLGLSEPHQPVDPVPFLPPVLPPVPALRVIPTEESTVESTGRLTPPLLDTTQVSNNVGGTDAADTDPDMGAACFPDAASMADCQSMTTSQYDALIHDELEQKWILNLSMHFRDKSKREKFFVTYREWPTLWRRVTISVDYRNAPENSLELELAHLKYQRDKIAKIYDAIRESLVDIKFYQTVTNLKLQTTEGRLHVHVVEDVNEIIHYPTVRMIQHLRCPHVKERDIEFESHMSGFVYKVRVDDEILIKKEIPGPDTVDEFLYEINALNRLRHSQNVIRFHGVIVDDNDEYVKGLLISYAEQGALIDVIYDQVHPMPWSTRERWAKQIISGLSEIHEAGFVQGDFTLSNIVIDEDDNAKIIDINRRGCPVGWEPPEASPLIECNQRISMYIGVKSDLYQLGMVLWALAMKEDEPETHGRPLRIGSHVFDVPDWYRKVVNTCLSDDPRNRLQALQLLPYFPDREVETERDRDLDMDGLYDRPSISVDDGVTKKEYFVDAQHSGDGYPRIRTVHPASDWSYVGWNTSHLHSPSDDPYFYPPRGRSPPSPMPSNPGDYEASAYGHRAATWASTYEGVAAPLSETNTTAPDQATEPRQGDAPRELMAAQGEIDEIHLHGSKESTEQLGGPDDVTEPTNADDPTKDTATRRAELLPIHSAEHLQSSEPAGNPGEEDVSRGRQEFVGLEPEHYKPTDRQSPAHMGTTEPEFNNNSSEGHARSYSDATTAQELETDISTITPLSTDTARAERSSGIMERSGVSPISVPLPPSGPPSETTEAPTDVPSCDTAGKACTEAVMSTVESMRRVPSTASRHSGSSTTLRDLPDDLKGVGATYDLVTEKRLDSIMDDDLTIFNTTLNTTDIYVKSKTAAAATQY